MLNWCIGVPEGFESYPMFSGLNPVATFTKMVRGIYYPYLVCKIEREEWKKGKEKIISRADEEMVGWPEKCWNIRSSAVFRKLLQQHTHLYQQKNPLELVTQPFFAVSSWSTPSKKYISKAFVFPSIWDTFRNMFLNLTNSTQLNSSLSHTHTLLKLKKIPYSQFH